MCVVQNPRHFYNIGMLLNIYSCLVLSACVYKCVSSSIQLYSMCEQFYASVWVKEMDKQLFVSIKGNYYYYYIIIKRQNYNNHTGNVVVSINCMLITLRSLILFETMVCEPILPDALLMDWELPFLIIISIIRCIVCSKLYILAYEALWCIDRIIYSYIISSILSQP